MQKKERAKDKLQTLLDIEGYHTVDDLINDCEFGPAAGVPGICTNEDCEYSIRTDPDGSDGWCEICQTHTVTSAYMLMGVF